MASSPNGQCFSRPAPTEWTKPHALGTLPAGLMISAPAFGVVETPLLTGRFGDRPLWATNAESVSEFLLRNGPATAFGCLGSGGA